jgi:MFS family permease
VWIPTLATFGQGLFMPFSGYLEERVGVRITILIGEFSEVR